MNTKRIYSVLALAGLLVSGLGPTASANSSADFRTDLKTVSGVIVQYAAGINPFAKNGEPTGANLLRGRISSEDLGGGVYVLNFADDIPKQTVRSWVKRMVLDRRISWAELNFQVEPAAVAQQSFLIPPVAKARPASGPRSLVARAAVRSSASDQARVRLTWRVPASRFGAEVVGYRILYSADGGQSYRTLISDTGNSKTRFFVSDGIRSGVSYRFRVRAITTDGSGSNTVGAISNTVSALVRTAPKPVVITSGAMVGPGSVSYFGQSLSDRGGFSKGQLRYRAVATAADIESVETSLCNETRCRFPDLAPDVLYTVEVFATNSLGTSSSNAAMTLNDFYFPVQWYLTGQNGVSMSSAWKYSTGDGTKVVAVIDTGIKEHGQLNKALTRNADGTIYGYDFISGTDISGDGDGEDPNPLDEDSGSSGSSFHGTFVAGIIAAQHDSEGTAGVAPNVKILPIRALGTGGRGSASDLIKAVNWAAGVAISGIPKNRYPVSVINLSLGATEVVPCEGGNASVFETAIAKGITVVVAAGNESRPSLSFPANCSGVITVAATQARGDRATYSNFGPGVFIAAPGGEFSVGSTESPESRGGIISSWIDGNNLPTYRLSEGTSMATPVVSGIVALMYSMQPNITPNRVRSILSGSVKPFPLGSSCSNDGGCGAGIVNAQLALARTSVLR